jgi:hypothetical protein
MSEYTEFFLNSKSSVVQLDLLEITHSSFSQDYNIVRNSTSPIEVVLEDSQTKTFIYYPLKITPLGDKNDLDQSIRVDLGDLGEIIPEEVDRVLNDNNFTEKPIVKYRTYRSDDLSQPLLGPWVLQIDHFTFNREGCSFEAKAPSLNINRTGELYRIDRFPMLRGFI